jgi:hypothetical protein
VRDLVIKSYNKQPQCRLCMVEYDTVLDMNDVMEHLSRHHCKFRESITGEYELVGFTHSVSEYLQHRIDRNRMRVGTRIHQELGMF